MINYSLICLIKNATTTTAASSEHAGTLAQAIAALCIGGMVTVRAGDYGRFAHELRDACISVAFKLGG